MVALMTAKHEIQLSYGKFIEFPYALNTFLKYHSPILRKGIYNSSVKLLLVLSIHCKGFDAKRFQPI